MENKLLLIIDPQVDFITGTLPVPGAEIAMNALSEYMRMKSHEYAHIIVTADRHPMRHCSFKTEGGEWNVHCVSDSVGAAIWDAIMDELLHVADKTTVLHKGENPDTEEYSIFKNKNASERILHIIDEKNIRQIDICGIAGDVCVADTIRDWMSFEKESGMLTEKIKLNVLVKFTPSIDEGKTLAHLISKYDLP